MRSNELYFDGVTDFCWLTTSDPDWSSINESEKWTRAEISGFVNNERYYLFIHIPPVPHSPRKKS